MSDLTDQERKDAQALWVELGKPEAAYPTPEQLLAFMRRCDDAAGLDLAARMVANAERAKQCFIAHHDGLLSELGYMRRELAEARMKLDAVDAWLKDDPDPLSASQTVPGVQGHLTGTENGSAGRSEARMTTGRDGGTHGE